MTKTKKNASKQDAKGQYAIESQLSRTTTCVCLAARNTAPYKKMLLTNPARNTTPAYKNASITFSETKSSQVNPSN